MELMEGLTLLSTSVIDNSSVFLILSALSFCLVAESLWLTVDCVMNHQYGGMIAGIILTIVSMVVMASCLGVASDHPQTRYKVTIDETVSMVEFYERYEIIDQDGLIFTITEKEVS